MLKIRTIFRILLSFIVLILGFSCQISMAQDCDVHYSKDDSPCPLTPKSATASVIDHIRKGFDQDLSSITGSFAKNKKSVYKERYNNLKVLIEDDYFLFFDSIQLLVNELGNRLIENNQISNKERIQFLISRSGTPNASCRGEGTIVINAGLITYLENTDQLAFILAHELAHHHFDHVNKSIHKRIEFLNSKETNEKLSASRKGKELANTELKDWLKKNTFDFSKHSRIHELQTDSMGIHFYIAAGFPASGALRTLQLLEYIDEVPTQLTSLKAYFDFDDYPWKEEWEISHLSGLSLVKITDEEKVLRRTHPEVEERIEQARLMLLDSVDQSKNNLCDWKNNLELEILERYYETRNLFYALVYGLQVLDKNPENIYVKAIIANCLLDLCQARKKHRASDYIPPPNFRMREDYFQMATFLDNLSFTSLKKITKKWKEKNCTVLFDEEIKEALEIKIIQMENDFIPATDRILKFQKKWPSSMFL